MVSVYEQKSVEIVVVEQAKPGNIHSGDAHVVIQEDNYTICAVVDGLGSGVEASESALAAIDVIENYHREGVQDIVNRCNKVMVNKRGIVMTILKFDFIKRELTYSNVGNITFVLYQPDGTRVQPIPMRGYLSGRKNNITSKNIRYQEGSAFMLYSDGVKIPFTKNMLLSMHSPKEDVKKMLTDGSFEVDDVTLLVGKLA
ncbi:PP2C family serine/threonine-protein phosphatase [Bacillus sp. FJAT-45037]|uniref:PP2C family serine/threonine-protein phosphatase n=1 Tax=Bacillus sp. FJAT-45037 TaxID=2011007 RepID=UPI000C2401D1|nr:PP2C family serine/threonine-protein phosphatase [Bacillus sp. FJAT-45037]